jgi:hypothetical protein
VKGEILLSVGFLVGGRKEVVGAEEVCTTTKYAKSDNRAREVGRWADGPLNKATWQRERM